MTKGPILDRRTFTTLAGAGLAMPFLNRFALGQELSGEVRIWTFLSRDGQTPREVVLRGLIEDFEAAHPGVSINVESQPFQELETRFVAAVAQGRAPDLIWMRDTFLSLVVDRDGLADLDEELSPEFREQAIPDMFQVFVEKSVFDGRRVSLPIWPSPAQVIFYRRDALAEIGLEEPPLEWGAFTDAAAELTSGDRIGFGVPTNDNSVSAFINIMTGFGPGIFDPETGHLDLTGPEALETARTVRELSERGAVSRTLLNAMGDDIQDQFAAGRFAIAQAFAPRFAQYQEIAAAYDPAELAVSAWPAFGDNPPPALCGPYWTVGLAATSQNKAAATAFLETLFSPEASMQWAQQAELVPDRQSVMADPWFDGEEARTIRDFEALLGSPGALVFPQRMPDVTRVFTVLNTSLQEIIGTEEALEPILERARAELGW